jgi:hypothetical protein
VGLKRVHPPFFCEGHCLSVAVFALRDLWGITLHSVLTERPEGLHLCTRFLVLAGQLQGLLACCIAFSTRSAST